VTAGTIFEGTRKPLRLWFLAAWDVTSHKYGASALAVQQILGLGSYETAWAWLHKLRRAMVRPGRDRLQGDVEVDETFVGGTDPVRPGARTGRRAIVAIAVELVDSHAARIRLRRVLDVQKPTLTEFVCDVVEPGSVVRTDGAPCYGPLKKKGFDHQVSVMLGAKEPAHVLMPHVHRVASLLKRWLMGTHQGSIAPEHLEYYLDEFAFRFNRRKSTARGLLFHRLLAQAVATKHTSTAALARGTGRGRPAGAKSES
jgi:transposase-like protein